MTYYGQWVPPVDEVLFINYFSGKKIGFFVECGAGNGVSESSCHFFEDVGWKGINIEPCLDVYKKLVENRPRATNLNIGLSDKDGITKFTVTTNGNIGVGGVTEEWHPKWKAEVISYGFKFQETLIDVMAYKNLISKYDVMPTLFVLDVDGHELQVIDGMVGAFILPKVICVEYTLVGLDSLIQKLTPMGYNYDFLSYNNAYFSMGQKQEKEWFGATEIWDY